MSKQTNEMSDKAHQEILALYENASMNIESLKTRFWTFIGFYSVISAFVYENLCNGQHKFGLFILQWFILLSAITGVTSTYSAIYKHRCRLDRIHQRFSSDFNLARDRRWKTFEEDRAPKWSLADILYWCISCSYMVITAAYLFWDMCN